MIHIVRNNAFGDVLWVEPVARHFIDKGNIVNILTWKHEVFNNYPSDRLYVNHPLPKWQKSILKRVSIPGLPKLINLNGAYESRPQVHFLQAYFDKAGITDTPLSPPKLYLNNKEKISLYSEKYVVLHIETHSINSRNVYGVNWTQVVKYLQNKGIKVIQLSKSGANVFCERYDAKDFRDVMRLLYNCTFFIGVDSGPSHIAACFDKPSIIFFGSVNPLFRHLTSNNKIFLQQDCKYAHCYHEVTKNASVTCKLAGEQGVPPCCLHSTELVINKIDQLYKNFNNDSL